MKGEKKQFQKKNGFVNETVYFKDEMIKATVRISIEFALFTAAHKTK